MHSIFKNRFRIFQSSHDGFSLKTQSKLIIALVATGSPALSSASADLTKDCVD